MSVLQAGDATEIVSAFYRELLGRDPDADGLLAYAGRVREGLPSSSIPAVLHELNASDEARRVRIGGVLQGITAAVLSSRGAGVRPVVALGTHCYTATLLKSAGLKQASYPFDWIFAGPDMVAHCLADDFAKFLDRSYYELVPRERRRDGPDVNLCDHTLYRDQFGVDFVFNHRNPLDDDDYAYLERCVTRFREVARDGRATFLLATFPSPNWDRGYTAVSDALRAYAPSARLVYVVVGEPNGTGLPDAQVVSERDGHTLVDFSPGSRWNPLWFDNALDDIAMLSLALERM